MLLESVFDEDGDVFRVREDDDDVDDDDGDNDDDDNDDADDNDNNDNDNDDDNDNENHNTAAPAYSYIDYSRFLAVVELNSVPFAFILLDTTAEPAYSRLQGNKEYRLLKEKSTITGIE